MRTARTLLVALVAVFVLQAAYYYPRLPEYLASNFAGDGSPNAYSSKTSYALLSFSMLALMLLSMVGLPSYLARSRPARLLKSSPKLPPAEARRRAVWVLGQLHWAATLTVAFLLVVNQMVMTANLSPEPRLSGLFLPLLVGYLAVLSLLIVRLVRAGRRAATDEPA